MTVISFIEIYSFICFIEWFTMITRKRIIVPRSHFVRMLLFVFRMMIKESTFLHLFESYPIVGVYITTCGRERFLNATISSFEKNTNFPFCEKLLIDDCDGVDPNKYPSWKVIRTNANYTREQRIMNANLLGFESLLTYCGTKLQ